ncbi:uncharacterized protein LOC126904674 [Daktulosphaira vitifoliae]|uniref:uncharacterized protein LOC126904674 n=1 Tax=Daktulosphaira vitifoliae TaxID=58002 RepID=UPI0021A9F275|nr:uncharacterized protein LOC126904674 [Daktulosphaira vitifoliae]
MSKVLSFLKNKVSVEPVGFLFFITIIFSSSLSTNLLLYKACDPSGTINNRVGARCDRETEVQHLVAPINGWKGMVNQIVPTVLTLFAGTWSDLHGRRRRPLIMGPIIGQIISDTVSVYCTLHWSLSPWLTAVFQVIPQAFSGGAPLMFIGIFAYVADTSTEEWRTVKFGMVTCVIFVGGILGMLIYGYAVVLMGFQYAYLLSISMGISTLILASMFIKDTAVEYHKQPFIRDIMNTMNPMTVFRSCWQVMSKARDRHVTLVLWLTIFFCAPLATVPLEGEVSITYLFFRNKFHWNEVDFSIFNAFQMAIILGGSIFSLSILSHKLKLNDALIGLIASVFDLMASIGFFLANEQWQVLLVPPLEMFRGAGLAITGSIASKCVDSDELGSMNSIKLLVESSVKGAFLPIYNTVYNKTLETMPSAFFLISSLLTFPLVFLFSAVYLLTRTPNYSASREELTKTNYPRTNYILDVKPINDGDIVDKKY